MVAESLFQKWHGIIGEKESTENHLALYELYQLLSEECHNSYFFSNLDTLEQVETGKETIALTEAQTQKVQIITGYFMDVLKNSSDWYITPFLRPDI